MPPSPSRRAALTGIGATALALALPGTANAQATAFGAFRLVRSQPGEPGQPRITLPTGYQLLAGAKYEVASRAEFYGFVQGPDTTGTAGVEVTVEWPGVPVAAVVTMETRLAVRRDPTDPYRFTVTLPVSQLSVLATDPTIQIWTYLDLSAGLCFKVEHNDPDRVAGAWREVAWPQHQARGVIHQLFAAYRILLDSGLKAAAAARGHRWFLAGFETNNTLHSDSPPHWHISYNSGPSFNSPTHNTHFWLDRQARTFYNGMDVTGLGRLKYRAGEPAPVYDFVGEANDGRGNLVATFTIRGDGGLDIAPPEGPVYAITPGRDGTLLDEVTVERGGTPWLRIATEDDYRGGVLTVRGWDLTEESAVRTRVVHYDPLTGVRSDVRE